MTFQEKQIVLEKKYISFYDSRLYEIEYQFEYDKDGILYKPYNVRNHELENKLFNNQLIENLSIDFLYLIYDCDAITILKLNSDTFDKCLKIFKLLDEKSIYSKDLIKKIISILNNRKMTSNDILSNFEIILESFVLSLYQEYMLSLLNLFFDCLDKYSFEIIQNAFGLLNKLLIFSKKGNGNYVDVIISNFSDVLISNKSKSLIDYLKKDSFTECDLNNILNIILFKSDSILPVNSKPLEENKLYLNKEFNKDIIPDLLYNLFQIDINGANLLSRVFGQFTSYLMDKNLTLEEKKYIDDLELIDKILHIDLLSSKERNTFYSCIKKRLETREFILDWYFKLVSIMKNLYTRLYNENCLNIFLKRGVKFHREINGVKIYETTGDFLALIHSNSRKQLNVDELDDIDYGTDRLENQVNTFKENWENKNEINNLVCLSGVNKFSSDCVINPDNNIYLGFQNFDFIDTMSPGDAYSGKFNNLSFDNFFIPPENLINESRYGYNELCVNLHKLPDYIFIRGDSFPDSLLDKLSFLNIPIVICKKNDYHYDNIDLLHKLGEKCSSLKMSNQDISDFITLFVNMYTNNLSTSNETLINYFNEWVYRFFKNLSYSSLDIYSCLNIFNAICIGYLDERRKYDNVKSIRPYAHSVRNFAFDDTDFIKIFRIYFNMFDNRFFDITNNFSLIYFMDDELLDDYNILNLDEFLNMSDLEIVDKITHNLEKYHVHKDVSYALITRCIQIKKKIKEKREVELKKKIIN